MATATMGPSSVDRLARSKRPTVERAEIHIPPAPVFPLEAVTGDPHMRVQAVAAFNNALQKWRNDAWSIEAPFVPDAELQNDVATLEATTAKVVTKLDRAAVDIRRAEANITQIDNSITEINNEITNINAAITGTGIVQANGSNPPTAITGSTGNFPYWQPMAPFLSNTSPIYTNGTFVGIGTVAPVTALHATTTDVAGGAVTTVLTLEHKVAAFMSNGGGTGLAFTGASDAVIGRDMALVRSVWTTAADATRTGALEWQTVNLAALTTRMALSGAGGLSVGDATNTMPIGVINAVTGFRLNNAATSGQVLMGNGTNIVLQPIPGPTYAFTEGSVIFAGPGGTSLAEDNTNLFWDNATNVLGLGSNTMPGLAKRLYLQTSGAMAADYANLYIVDTATTTTVGTDKYGIGIDMSGSWNAGSAQVWGVTIDIAGATPSASFAGGLEVFISGAANASIGLYAALTSSGINNTAIQGIATGVGTTNIGGNFSANNASGSNIGILVSATGAGQFAIGVTAGTVGLAVGGTTVVPLLFQSGTNLTTPLAGGMEYNGRFFLTDTDAARRHVVQAVNATKTTAGAPYTNDGYAELVINGTTLRVMTTAG